MKRQRTFHAASRYKVRPAGAALRTACAFLLVVPVANSARPPARSATSMSWPNECRSLPGYAEFRTALDDAVHRRDAAAFRKLFSTRGQMRINGLGLQSDESRWSVDSVGSAGPWTELEQLLPLGCWRNGERLLIPYAAKYVKQGILVEPTVVALRATSVFQAPDASSRVLSRVPRGAFVQEEDPYAPTGWIRVKLGHGRDGFIRSADVRSGGAAALKMVNEDGRWRIVWFGGYD
jgi:hypothetical protein